MMKAFGSADFDKISEIISATPSFYLCAYAIGECLESENVPVRLLKLSLRRFIQLLPHSRDLWVHSYSHFSRLLWKKRLIGWIMRLNRVALQAVTEAGSAYCAERLVWDFAVHARWSDDPAQFSLNELVVEKLDWSVMPKFVKYVRLRLRNAPFTSESSFVRWQLRHPEGLYYWDHEGVLLFDFDKMDSSLRRLRMAQTDRRKANSMRRAIAESELRRLRRELAACSDSAKHSALLGAIGRVERHLLESG
jgi:hypothetical protein